MRRLRLSLGGSRARRRVGLLLAVGGWMTAVVMVAYATGALRSQELDSVHERFTIRGRQPPPKDVVIVDVDDSTFSNIPDVLWPYPRSYHARVIDRIVADRPKAIAFDIQVTERSKDDEVLAKSIYNATQAGIPVVLDTTETDNRGGTRILTGDKVLKLIGARPSSALFPAEPDQAIRRVSYAMGGLETLAVVTTEVLSHHPVGPALFGGHPAWIDFPGPAGTVPSVPYYNVFAGKTPRGYFRGKVVFIGVSATSLQDLHATSYGASMPGVEVQANAFDTVRRSLPLRGAPGWLNLGLILVLGLVAPVASLRFSPLRSLALALVLGAAFVAACQLAFDAGLILAFVYPLVALFASASGSLGVHYATASSERERVRDLFSRFVPENVVGEVLARTDGGLRLGGVHRVSTVMFTDLRGFTSFAEALPPDRVIAVLNQYLSAMSDAILDHGGTLVAYMGDGIMAVFGAPIEADDHADQAVATAREMLDVRLPGFNAWLREEGLGDGFRMGIGLNSGPVMSGNVGSERRVEYTAIGDTTNTASRIEGMTKGTPHQLLFTETTRELLRHPPADVVFVAELEVRGRQGTVKLYTLARAELPGPPGPPAAAAAAGTSAPPPAS